MLLNIYLGTTAINWITVFIYGTACDRKLKRKGYKYVEDKFKLCIRDKERWSV